jgi:hypothetical protein
MSVFSTCDAASHNFFCFCASATLAALPHHEIFLASIAQEINAAAAKEPRW